MTVHYSYRSAEAAIKRQYLEPSLELIEIARERIYERILSDAGELVDKLDMVDTDLLADQLRILLDKNGDWVHAARTITNLLDRSIQNHARLWQREELEKMEIEALDELASYYVEVEV